MRSYLEDCRVLVLNRLWQAVNICTLERATTLLYTGHAQVIYEDDGGIFNTFEFADWCGIARYPEPRLEVRTVSMVFDVPRVILLKRYDRFPCKEVKFTRSNIFARDNHTCQYCGKKPGSCALNIDHVVPRNQGGAHKWTNVVCSCVPCNTRKADRTPEEAGMRLARKPAQPAWRSFVELKISRHLDQKWQRFLSPVASPATSG